MLNHLMCPPNPQPIHLSKVNVDNNTDANVNANVNNNIDGNVNTIPCDNILLALLLQFPRLRTIESDS